MGLSNPDAAEGFDLFSRLRRERQHELQRADAIREAKRSASGLGRAERRRILLRALEDRGLTETPLWVETVLDRWDSAGKASAWADVVQSFAGAKRALRYSKEPHPVWVLPPPKAILNPIPTRRGDRQVAVDLDPAQSAWLTRALDAAPYRVGNVAKVQVWLRFGADGSVLDVSLGKQCVGTLSGAEVEAFRPFVAAAAAEGEFPCIEGELARLRSSLAGFLLQIPLPNDGIQVR